MRLNSDQSSASEFDLSIIGASVRAAAQSALRAGIRPLCADLFADRDLRASTQCHQIAKEDFPRGLESALEKNHRKPWIYTGGLENYPELIGRWSKFDSLCGNRGQSLINVRDPDTLRTFLRTFEISFPMSFWCTTDFDLSSFIRERLLMKPIRSAGGLGIQHWHGEELGSGRYLQEFVEGQSVSGVFVIRDDGFQLIGVSQQLVGEPWLHAPAFHYCGSIGPLADSKCHGECWRQIGKMLRAAELRGIVGVDAILRGDDVVVIEINPRYTASVEVFELALGKPLLTEHFRSFGIAFPINTACKAPQRIIGKAVYFAPFDMYFPVNGPWDAVLVEMFDPWTIPTFADIPAAGLRFHRGDPVISVLVESENFIECRNKLMERASMLDHLFGQSRLNSPGDGPANVPS